MPYRSSPSGWTVFFVAALAVYEMMFKHWAILHLGDPLTSVVSRWLLDALEMTVFSADAVDLVRN